MKKNFLIQAVKFIGLVALLLLVVIILSEIPLTKSAVARLTNTIDYIENASMTEMQPFIEKVSEKDEKTKLIIGDSVCSRLFLPFEELNPDYCIAGTNRGLGAPGQYIMMKLFLDSHPNATEVDLVLTTNSMITGYENLYGYQYSTQPFLENDCLDMLDEETRRDMRKAYGFFVTNKTMVRIVDGSPILKKAYLNLLNRYNAIYVLPAVPDVVEKYIMKMKKECDKKGIAFHLVSAPISDTEGRKELEETIAASYRETDLQIYFPNYYDNLFYYSPEHFPDGIHPITDIETLKVMVENIKSANNCMVDFQLSD